MQSSAFNAHVNGGYVTVSDWLTAIIYHLQPSLKHHTVFSKF